MEAALVIPLWLAMCVLVVDVGVQLYQDSRKLVAELETMEEIDVIHLFYISNGIGDVIGDGASLY